MNTAISTTVWNAPESAGPAIERYEAQAEVAASDIEGVAEFITACLTRGPGMLSKVEARITDEYAVAMAVELDSGAKGADETNSAFATRLALTDPTEAGIFLQELGEKVIKEIAYSDFEEYEQDARNMGYIK